LLLLAVVSILVSLIVNYSLKVVKLVSLLLIINYVMDLMMCVILVLCMIYHIYSTCFGGSPSREATKIGGGKKNKTLIVRCGLPSRPPYIHRWAHMSDPCPDPHPSTFVGRFID
jgi:hypothetical protein